MKAKLLGFLAILYGLTPDWSIGEMRIRVADYNIKFLSAAALNAKPERKERLQAVIEELKPDIVGLQEIRDRQALEQLFEPNFVSSPPEAQTKLRTPRVVQRALNALSHSRFFANVAFNVFVADLKQVYAYLHDDAVRQKAQRRLENVITNQTRVIVGHSLGTVVAYEALCAHPEWPVRTFALCRPPGALTYIISLGFRQATDHSHKVAAGAHVERLG